MRGRFLVRIRKLLLEDVVVITGTSGFSRAMERYLLARDVAWGLAAIVLGTLLSWWLLARFARRLRHHFDSLLEMAQQSLDAPHDVAAVRARMTALRLLTNAVKYGLVISAILMALRRLGVQLDALLLPAGFVGAALGLGAQNLVRDVVAGLFLVLEGQFAVGDVVGINGTVGTVDEIGLRVTRLRDEASHTHFFPNGAINSVEKFPREPLFLLLRVPLDTRAKSASSPEEITAAKQSSNAASLFAAAISSGKIENALPAKSLEASSEPISSAAPPSHDEATPGLSLSNARRLVLQAVEHFNADYHVLEGKVEVWASSQIDLSVANAAAVPEEKSVSEGEANREAGELANDTFAFDGDSDESTLCFQLPVRALRVALVREKLPPRVVSILEAHGLKVRPGAEVGLFHAPATQNETA